MTSLPQELAETIVDILQDDIGGLKACASVSRVWNHRSRLHLLHKGVVLDMQDTAIGASDFEKEITDRFTAFRHLLSTQPAMIEHVQSFETRNFVGCLSDERTNLLVEIMQALRHIRQLTFRNVHWYCISNALRKGFMATLRLPSLVSVDFHDFATSHLSTLVSLLALPPNLQDMRISDSRRTKNSGGITIEKVRRSLKTLRDGVLETCIRAHLAMASGHRKQLHPLQSLSISMGLTKRAIRLLQSLFGKDNSPYTLKGLRRLRVSKACYTQATCLLFEVSFPSLEEFEIIDGIPSLNSIYLVATIYLGRLPRLHRLLIPCTFLDDLMGPTYSSLDQRHPLEYICIRFRSDLSDWTLDSLSFMDATLAQAAFAALRRVELRIANIWAKDYLLGRLPELKDRGVEITVITETNDC
ncbi:hypothetical protein FPV67DRAFT_1488913 [Lyophyllum atratum]|nr:hypothetical protein FPV67DRAFT_1488913 [Lyophyllum atratum]